MLFAVPLYSIYLAPLLPHLRVNTFNSASQYIVKLKTGIKLFWNTVVGKSVANLFFPKLGQTLKFWTYYFDIKPKKITLTLSISINNSRTFPYKQGKLMYIFKNCVDKPTFFLYLEFLRFKV